MSELSREDLCLKVRLVEEGKLRPRVGETYNDAFIRWKEENDGE